MAIAGTAWRFASEKLLSDFRGSCLHDLELLFEALEESNEPREPLSELLRELRDGRAPHEPLFIPVRSVCSATSGAQKAVAARAAKLIAHAQATPLVIDVGPYKAACIAVIQSLRRRYGLELRADFDGLTERQPPLRLVSERSADFLFAPRPQLGDEEARQYRRVTPVHSCEQVLLRKNGRARGKHPRVLVGRRASPFEPLLAHATIPAATAPEELASLEALLEAAPGLSAGDFVIAWQPIASGLEAQCDFTSQGEDRYWVSLCSHERWHQGALRALADQFLELFASEWTYCRRNSPWAIECLALDPEALKPFGSGSPLNASPSSPRL